MGAVQKDISFNCGFGAQILPLAERFVPDDAESSNSPSSPTSVSVWPRAAVAVASLARDPNSLWQSLCWNFLECAGGASRRPRPLCPRVPALVCRQSRRIDGVASAASLPALASPGDAVRD